MDLVDIMQTEEAKEKVKATFDTLNDNQKLELCRDLMIDQICATIDKFPLQTQKEILTLVTHKYLCEWEQ